MASKKDFSGISADTTGSGTVFAAIEQGTHTMGQQTTVSPQERAERMSAMRTQGRKGCKAIRINMAFSPENHQFINVVSRAQGITLTAFCNEIVRTYREEHPEMMEHAQAVIDEVRDSRLSKRFASRKED